MSLKPPRAARHTGTLLLLSSLAGHRWSLNVGT